MSAVKMVVVVNMGGVNCGEGVVMDVVDGEMDSSS